VSARRFKVTGSKEQRRNCKRWQRMGTVGCCGIGPKMPVIKQR